MKSEQHPLRIQRGCQHALAVVHPDSGCHGTRPSRWIVGPLSLALLFAGLAVGQETRSLIKQAMDEPARITLEKTTIVGALEEITRQTGVRLVMDADAVGLLPYGIDTELERVSIAGIPLRQGLSELLTPLAMRYVVQQDCVAIEPTEPLSCLARPPTWGELETIARLAGESPGISEQDRARLKERVQFHVSTPNAWQLLAGAMANVGAGPGDQILTVACRNLGWAWCPSEDKVLVLPATRLIKRQLGRPITVRMHQKPLMAVMTAVGKAVGVRVQAEPGTLAALPDHVRDNFSIDAHGHTAEQTLDTIAEYTGLGYLIEPQGVTFYRPGDGPPPSDKGVDQPTSVTRGASDPYVAKIVVQLDEGRTIEWLIRASELPDDLKETRQKDIDEVIQAMRERAIAGGS